MNREAAIAELVTILQPGSTVYTEIAYVERTHGRQRDTHIKLYVLEDNEPRSIAGLAGCAIGSRMNKSGDAIISVNFLRDAEFAVVAALSATLFRNGFECIGKGCPSHEHARGDSNYAPHPHKDGRDALKALGLKYRNDYRGKGSATKLGSSTGRGVDPGRAHREPGRTPSGVPPRGRGEE